MYWYDVLKALREKSGESMSKTAESIGIPKGTYASYEYGKREPNIDMISKISEHFGVTTDYLLGRESASEDDLTTVIKNSNVQDLEEILIRQYLKLSDDQREAVLDFMRRAIQEEAGRRGIVLHRNGTETVQEAARGSNLPNATSLATYTAEQLQRLDNAPDVDPDL